MKSEATLIRNRGKAFTLLEGLLSFALIAVLILFGLVSFTRIAASARAASCVSNLRGLHSIMNQYADDHRNCFPIGYDSVATWTSRTAPYRSNSTGEKVGITYCPATHISGTGIYKRDANTWRTDYNFNRFVASNDEAANLRTRIPGNLIFFFDGSGTSSGSAATSKESKRHNGRLNIVFVDGHVETTSQITDYDLCWKPAAP